MSTPSLVPDRKFVSFVFEHWTYFTVCPYLIPVTKYEVDLDFSRSVETGGHMSPYPPLWLRVTPEGV